MQASVTSGFHLQQQQPQLQPALKLWEQLSATLTPAMRQLVANAAASKAVPAAATASRAPVAGGGADAVSPVAAFVALEFELAVSLLRQVAQTLSGIQAALTGDAHLVTAATQVRVNCSKWWFIHVVVHA